MSSFIRRVQRQRSVSRLFAISNGKEGTPRDKFHNRRGYFLGVNNPTDKALLARVSREEKKEHVFT